jgi:hypothetical protein
MTPTLSKAKKANNPLERSRPLTGQPGHFPSVRPVGMRGNSKNYAHQIHDLCLSGLAHGGDRDRLETVSTIRPLLIMTKMNGRIDAVEAYNDLPRRSTQQ